MAPHPQGSAAGAEARAGVRVTVLLNDGDFKFTTVLPPTSTGLTQSTGFPRAFLDRVAVVEYTSRFACGLRGGWSGRGTGKSRDRATQGAVEAGWPRRENEQELRRRIVAETHVSTPCSPPS